MNKAVVEFLPKTDAVIIVIDANGGITQGQKEEFKKLNSAIQRMQGIKDFDLFVVCNKIDCIPVQERAEKMKYIMRELKQILPIVKESDVHRLSCKDLVPMDPEIQQLITNFLGHLSCFIVKLLRSQQNMRLAILEDHFGPLNQFISM